MVINIGGWIRTFGYVHKMQFERTMRETNGMHEVRNFCASTVVSVDFLVADLITIICAPSTQVPASTRSCAGVRLKLQVDDCLCLDASRSMKLKSEYSTVCLALRKRSIKGLPESRQDICYIWLCL